MIAVIQRVKFARVTIENQNFSEIGHGLLVLLGVSDSDLPKDSTKLSVKIPKLRIFSDFDGKMNLSVLDVGGEILVVSQFTLLADASQGNRPSYIKAARPEVATPLYQQFCKEMEINTKKEVKTGMFGADMKIELLNDGPVTIILDSNQLK
jgi:D-tyrosyl-tRNA(Tyr) deacylase